MRCVGYGMLARDFYEDDALTAIASIPKANGCTQSEVVQ
jgi:hypothetical protein